MAAKIRLKRMGKIRSPHFRIVVMDSRKKRDGRAIEEIGKYHPKNDPSVIEVDTDRVQYWLGVGAQPTEAVVAILKRTGDWQKFSGDTSPSGIDGQPEKADKLAAFNVALAEIGGAPDGDAISKSDKKDKKSDDKKADKVKSDDKAEAKSDDKPKSDKADAKSDDKAKSDKAEAKSDDKPKADKSDDKAEAKSDDKAEGKDYGKDAFRGEKAPAGFDIKGNEDSMKFHAPESPWYDRTIAEVWFNSAEAAEAAGFVNAVKSDEDSADKKADA